jgi:hypothetical protein
LLYGRLCYMVEQRHAELARFVGQVGSEVKVYSCC